MLGAHEPERNEGKLRVDLMDAGSRSRDSNRRTGDNTDGIWKVICGAKNTTPWRERLMNVFYQDGFSLLLKQMKSKSTSWFSIADPF